MPLVMSIIVGDARAEPVNYLRRAREKDVNKSVRTQMKNEKRGAILLEDRQSPRWAL
jgi:hypothetical protein